MVNVWFPDMNVEDADEFLKAQTREDHEKRMIAFLKENGFEKTAGKVIPGFPAVVLQELSKDADTAMIVMGKQGENTGMKKVFGSVSSIVAKEAYCPVLLIPDNTPWKGNFKNIMVAAGVEATDEKGFNRILDLTRALEATVHFVHVKKSPKDAEGLRIADDILDRLIREKSPDFAFNVVDITYKDVIEGLNKYARENNIDLIVMLSRHRKWWSDLFHKSVTKQAAIATELPLLAMHLDDH